MFSHLFIKLVIFTKTFIMHCVPLYLNYLTNLKYHRYHPSTIYDISWTGGSCTRDASLHSKFKLNFRLAEYKQFFGLQIPKKYFSRYEKKQTK